MFVVALAPCKSYFYSLIIHHVKNIGQGSWFGKPWYCTYYCKQDRGILKNLLRKTVFPGYVYINSPRICRASIEWLHVELSNYIISPPIIYISTIRQLTKKQQCARIHT